MGAEPHSEAWKKMVLRSMPTPAWLQTDAPQVDVVISSRCRFARNLRGFRFPNFADPSELLQTQALLEEAGKAQGMATQRGLTDAERDFMLGSRLISPEFQAGAQGRTLMLDPSRTVSVMINEEDHLRLQAMTAGLSQDLADQEAEEMLAGFSQLPWMRTEQWGWLTSSPMNAGEARRRSALFHLLGLAHTGRLASVLKALAAQGITARGLYGEASKAVGSFFQVSLIRGDAADFKGACSYLAAEERKARREVTRLELSETAQKAREFAVSSVEITMADALRVLGWARWAAAAGAPGFSMSIRDIDHWTATMEVHGTQDPKMAARHRATFLRERIERSGA